MAVAGRSDEARAALFPKLDEADIDRIRRFARNRAFNAGEPVATVGTASNGARILTKGRGPIGSALTAHLLGEHGAEDDTLEAPHGLDATLSLAQERGSLLRGHEEGGQICGVRFRG